MKATTKKTTVSTELLELQNEKKELKKLTKIIEKTPSKKEIKTSKKNEYNVEIQALNFTVSPELMLLINRNVDINEAIKTLKREELENSKNIFLMTNEMITNLKNELDSNIQFKHLHFEKKAIINILKLRLDNAKLPKELIKSLNIALEYKMYNLSLNLEFVTMSQVKKITEAYIKCVNQVPEYSKITKNFIAKAKDENTIKTLLKSISEANKKFNSNIETIKQETLKNELRVELLKELNIEKIA